MENITEIVCPNCGEKLRGDSVFCAKCGTRLNEDAQQEVQGVEQAAKPTGFFAKYKKIIGIAAAAVIIVLFCLPSIRYRERILRKSCFAIGVRWKGRRIPISSVYWIFPKKKWNTGWKQDMHGWIPLWQLMIIRL